VPVGTCLGETSCACVGGTLTGTTTAVTRTNRFITVSAWGENIAYGYATPRQTFYQWLWEAESSAACGFRSTNGHRYNILEPSRRLLGNGYYRISRHMWVQDFNGGSNPTGTLIAGGHEPQFSGGTVEFRVNYFDTGAPMQATVNVDGACSPMAIERRRDERDVSRIASLGGNVPALSLRVQEPCGLTYTARDGLTRRRLRHRLRRLEHDDTERVWRAAKPGTDGCRRCNRESRARHRDDDRAHGARLRRRR
jgi:hypothetical protein